MEEKKEIQGQPSGSIPGEVVAQADTGSVTFIPMVPKRTDSLENLDEIDRGVKDETPLCNKKEKVSNRA